MVKKTSILTFLTLSILNCHTLHKQIQDKMPLISDAQSYVISAIFSLYSLCILSVFSLYSLICIPLSIPSVLYIPFCIAPYSTYVCFLYLYSLTISFFSLHTLLRGRGQVPCSPPPVHVYLTLRDSPQLGLGPGRSGSGAMGSRRCRKSNITQSMILMMR